jgi:hypothetical protein
MQMQLIFDYDPSKSEEMPMAMGDRVDQEDAVVRMSYAQQLLVRSWRKIVRGDGGYPLIACEFSRLCGDDACEVLATLYTFLQALSYAGRRHQQVGHPGCAVLTSDEQRMLALSQSRSGATQ